MRSLLVVMLLPCLMAAAFAQTAPPPARSAPPGATSAKSPLLAYKSNLPFDVSLPPDWQSIELQDGMSGVSIASQKEPPYSMIRLMYLPKEGRSVNLHDEFNNFEAALKQAGVTAERVSEKALNCGGIDGLLRQYNVTSKAGKLSMKIWFASGTRNFYSFQLTSPPSNFAADSTTFDRVLLSVDF